MLDLAAVVDPSKIISKIKFHLLTHIPDDVRRFGPVIGVSTEDYESFNTVFRQCSILSNHQAPSRDTAYQLATQETFKHLICGGWWADAKGNDMESAAWKQPGTALRKYVSGSDVLQRIFDFSSPEQNVPVLGRPIILSLPVCGPHHF